MVCSLGPWYATLEKYLYSVVTKYYNKGNILLLIRTNRQGNRKRGTLPGVAINLDTAIMPLDDAVDRR